MMRTMSSFILIIFLGVTFLRAQEKKYDADNHNFEAIDAYLQPPGGMDKFKLQWIDYLDSLAQKGVLQHETLYSDSVFSIIISRNGVLIAKNKSPQDSILWGFLKTQKRWRLEWQSGRPVNSLLKMKIPKEIFQG